MVSEEIKESPVEFDFSQPPEIEAANRAGHAVDQQFDPFSRTIYLINDRIENLQTVMPQLLALDAFPGTIYIVICTGGGVVDVGMALYSVIKGLKNKVVTIGIGPVYSMGAVLLQAGDERVLDPFSRVLFHPGSGEISGHWSAITAGLAECEEWRKLAHNEVQKRAKLSKKEVNELFASENYLSARQAVKKGLADKVTRNWYE